MARLRDLPNNDPDLAITPGTGFRVVTTGQGNMLRTVITADGAVLPAIAGGANLAVGVLAATFPAGDIQVFNTKMDIALTQTEGNVTADTPDVGVGTTIGSGVVAVLGGTAAFENLLTGQAAADCDGTATVKTVNTQLMIESGDDHTVYLNAADGWAASGEAEMIVSGEIIILWAKVDN